MISTLLAGLALGQPAPTITPTKIVATSLFKNGYAVVTRSAMVPASGDLVIGAPPGGSLGTVWITAKDDVKISQAVTTSILTTQTRPAANMAEVVAANKGKSVVLLVSGLAKDGVTELPGKLLEVAGDVVIVEVAGGRRAIPRAWIQSIYADNDQLIYSVSGEIRQPVVRITATPGKEIRIIALQRGLTWAPSYNIDISDPKKLRITGKAVILNDIEDMNNIEARLITGFPNISFLGLADPFTSGQTVDQFVNALMGIGAASAPGGFGGGGGGMAQNAMRRDARGSEGGVFEPFDPSQLEGFQAEDLFFYRQPGVQLKRGDRGYFILFQAESDYEHIYTLDVGAGEVVSRESIPSGSPSPYDVWHELKFRNTAKLPLTTAPAITTQAGEILGQDQLNYTSPNQEAFVKITKALDIRADLDEEEIARERGAIKVDNYPRYDLVTVKGTIEIRNRKPQAVTMRIAKLIVGEVVSATNDGKITKTTKGLADVNVNSRVAWTPKVESGATLQMEYRYQVYVPAGR